MKLFAAIVLTGAMTAACSSSSPAPPAPSAPAAPSSPGVPGAGWPTTDWSEAEPQTQGVDPAAMAQLDKQVADTFTEVRSVVVVRHGYVVHERYWHGLSVGSGHDVRSVTKSVVGTLVGIALAEGKIKSLDQTVGELLAAPESPLAGVTVRHLLTMTSGLAGDPAGEDDMLTSPNWVRQILSRRLIVEPGTRFSYSSASSHLLSAIVATTTGGSTLDYARAKLFEPLGIDTSKAYEPVFGGQVDGATLAAYDRSAVAWPVDPQGVHYGAAFLRLPSRELAKIGYLYLHGGRWDDRQIVPADWVTASTSRTGLPPDVESGYGLHWWFETIDGARAFSAVGYGGQYIYVVPALDLVVVLTNNPDAGPGPESLLTGTIVPAVAP
ncbi:serine hydrolase domain-containing protein [Paractinoplanes maris]|uniref:serine hydrolase domain-containing protein n=1 Tax=Paractinoplanes maris TaxID=1734446 RepID=UPI002020DDC2|nr:serine hydrolase [Actinoplanes maris]